MKNISLLKQVPLVLLLALLLLVAAQPVQGSDDDDDKQHAVDLADEAIANLPHASMITLDDKEDVEDARYLVGRAKSQHGAKDSDFEKLDWLVAAEEAIAALEKPDPDPEPDPDPDNPIYKTRAINMANDAIYELPDPADIILANRAAIENARYLVGSAKSKYGAVDSDFDNLAKLEAAERKIKELEGGESPGLPTWVYFVLGGLGFLVVILLVIIAKGSKRSK